MYQRKKNDVRRRTSFLSFISLSLSHSCLYYSRKIFPLLLLRRRLKERRKKIDAKEDFWFSLNSECRLRSDKYSILIINNWSKFFEEEECRYVNMEIIYLLLSLTIVLLVLSVPATIRRLNIICPRRVRSGGLVFDDEGLAEEIVGRFSNVLELRRRFWLAETQKVQAEAIPPRRRRFFFDLFPMGMVVIEEDVEDVLFVLFFRWFRISVVDGRREERLGVELFRRV